MSESGPIFVSPTPPPTAEGWAKIIYQLITSIVQIASLPFEVVLRKQMGVRYLSAAPVLASLILIIASGFFGGWLDRSIDRTAARFSHATGVDVGFGESEARDRLEAADEAAGFNPAFAVILAVYLVAVLGQVTLIGNRQRKGIRCHSRYGGDSWGFWSKIPRFPGQYYWQYYIEPLGIVVTGLALRGISPSLSLYFLIGGLGLFIKHNLAHRKFMTSVLDAMDAQIESRWASEYMTDWKEPGAIATEGFVVPPFIMKQSRAEKLQYFATTAKLDPKLQDLMRGQPGETAKTGAPHTLWTPSGVPPASKSENAVPNAPPPATPAPPGLQAPTTGRQNDSLLTGDGPRPPTLPPWDPNRTS